jgi:hypothetical protein
MIRVADHVAGATALIAASAASSVGQPPEAASRKAKP